MNLLKGAEDDMFVALLDQSQSVVMSFEDREEEYETAELWNALDEASIAIQENYQMCVETLVSPLATYLERLITVDDETLMSRPRNPAIEEPDEAKITRIDSR